MLSPEGAAAHGANESRFGNSQLAAELGNVWGVKATSSWAGETVELPTWEEVDGRVVQVTASFRAYPSWVEAVADYADLIERLYPFAARHAAHPVAFLAGLFVTGPRRWATDSQALPKALSILEAFGLLDDVGAVQRLGRHEVLVDNAPTLGKALEVAKAALAGRPAVTRSPHLVTRTRRPDGSWKLDLDRAE